MPRRRRGWAGGDGERRRGCRLRREEEGLPATAGEGQRAGGGGRGVTATGPTPPRGEVGMKLGEN